VYPELVGRDAEGRIVTVKYQDLIPMLLNEVQGQQRMIEAQHQALEREHAQRLEQAAQLRAVAEQLTELKTRMAALQP
jgi:Tfp pilus assembly protein PilO